MTGVFYPGNKFSDNSFMTSYGAIRYYQKYLFRESLVSRVLNVM